MSAPKIIVQIVVVGAQIFGKALWAAGKQAAKNAQTRPAAALGDAAGVSNATSGSITDKLTREHRMTLDEARLILNLKRGDMMEQTLRNYEHLFKMNSPPPPPEKPPTGGGRAKPSFHSHYLQSKVVRAKERLEAELKVVEDAEATSTEAQATQTSSAASESPAAPEAGKPTDKPPSPPPP